MTDYGMTLVSAHGTMCLDSEHSVYQYGEHGTLTLNAWGNTANPSECSVTFVSSHNLYALVACRWRGSESGWMNSPIHVTISGGAAVGFMFIMGKSLPTTYPFYCDWVVFNPVTDADKISGSYGMNIYNSAGAFIWSSDVKSPMRLRTVYPHPLLPRGAEHSYRDPTYPTTNYYYIRCINTFTGEGGGYDTRLIWEVTY